MREIVIVLAAIMFMPPVTDSEVARIGDRVRVIDAEGQPTGVVEHVIYFPSLGEARYIARTSMPAEDYSCAVGKNVEVLP